VPGGEAVTQTTEAPATVPYEVWKQEHDLRIKVEKERDYWEKEFHLLRKLRRAPVLKPVAKEVLEEFRHVEKWGKVKAPDGSTRANYKTIANLLHMSPDTVARQAERLEKLDLVEIHEHQGPKDETERKYVHVKEEKLSTINKLEDPKKVIPKQGGNRYICTKCDSPDVDVKTDTTRKTTIRCNCCHFEEVVEDTAESTGWKPQLVHKRRKAQKQDAFQQSKHSQEQNDEAQKQPAEHCVDTQSVEDMVPADESHLAHL
jgi:DNA-binding MarR family transcriptional regulator